MRFTISFAVVFLCSTLAVIAQQTQTHTVIVGGNGTLTFDPSEIQVAAGDMVAFEFHSKNHSATQSSFTEPCTYNGGVNSGFMAISPALADGTGPFPTWTIIVQNASIPMWFFCAQVGHCSKGMVFAINPTDAKPFDAFKAAALAQGSGSALPNSSSSESPSGTPSGAIAARSLTHVGAGLGAAVLGAFALVAL